MNSNKNQTMKSNSVYTVQEFNSGDGMLTQVWGPGMWHFLHTMSFNYPIRPSEHDKKHYRDFVLSMQYILPCGKCRDNLKKNFKTLPLSMKHMKSRESFSKYIFELHETINTMLGKKSGLTYEIIRERYEHFRSRCTKSLRDKKKNKTKKVRFQKTEDGCTVPLYGEKSKCVLQIVPEDMKCETLQIDNQCIKQRFSGNIESALKK